MSKKKTEVTPLVTKTEAIAMISSHLRKPNITPGVMVKLLNMLAQLQGWEKQTPKPKPEDGFDTLVREIERKRREQAAN